jgi:hypothetical protein
LKKDKDIKFIKIVTVTKVAQLAIIKSLLEGAKISYYVTNEYFSTLYGGANGLTKMDILVSEEDLEEVKNILKDFL